MSGYYIGNKFKMICGNSKIKKGLCGGNVIYSGANPVTYYVDINVVYTEEVDDGNTLLSPTTFIPTKDGWTFVGWRMDDVASGNIYENLVMEDAPIILYAVFEQTITLSYNGNGSTSGSMASQTGTRYYNNGNVANPSFTLGVSGFTKTDYSFTNWAIGSAGGTQYEVGASVMLSTSTTFYAVWTYTSWNPIINGVLQTGNYIAANRSTWGAANGVTLPNSVHTHVYGMRGTGSGEEDDGLGAYITFNTQGCSKITVVSDYDSSSMDTLKTYLMNGAWSAQSYVENVDNNRTVTFNIDSSKYTTVTILVQGFDTVSSSSHWMWAGIQTITCS